MKELLKIASALCALLTLVILVFGFRSLTGHNYYLGFAMFSMLRNGTIMGFLGNILSIAFTAIGFGMMTFYGFAYDGSAKAKKRAFIWGIVMCVLCLISLICSFVARTFNFGDVVLLILPVVYTYSVIESA